MTAFGLLLPTREIVMTQAIPNFAQILDLAEQAEALGFDSVWVGDSVLARPRFEALTTLAAVAARSACSWEQPCSSLCSAIQSF